jgi:hypothetical protein
MSLAKLKLNICFVISVYLVFIILGICSGETIPGEIYNGDFELFDPNDGSGFDKPTGWNTDNYAASVTLFKPEIESPQYGSYENWKIDPITGLPPFEGDRLVVLSTGQIQRPGSTNHGTISQNIQVNAEQTLFGAYFFGTCDYLSSFNDFAWIRLVADANSSYNDIDLVHIDVEDVGSYGSTDGWQRFEHFFTQQEEGTYDLVCQVEDYYDNIVNSYLAVDNFRLCVAPEYGDINYDCQTDMKDFGLLAYTWLCDYRDPNNITDPNDILYGDLDENDWVNADDLSLMAGSWLTGE